MLDLSTRVSVPPDRAFELLTDPAVIPLWWGPHGFDTPHIDLDLRPGGHYRFTMQPPDAEHFHLSGTFTEVLPGERLGYTFVWEEPDPDDVETLVTLTLHEVDEGTEIRLHQGVFATADRLALHRGGWSDGFERLSLLT
jgi:uncharacterized protein YndB with AHSA1/START domain